MKKSLLLQFIKGETGKDQEKEILEWIKSSPDNEAYFHNLHNLWVSANICDKPASEQELQQIRLLTTKKEGSSPFRKYLPYAAIFLLTISVLLNLYLAGDKTGSKAEDVLTEVKLQDLPEGLKHEMYTENGVKARITLPDSSVVWLNSGSRIVFPDRFTGNTREVHFSGEAFFDVRPDPLKPMVISTNKNFDIEVLGTTFNIKSYDNDREARTTLYSGSVNIISKNIKDPRLSDRLITTLKPFETCTIGMDNKPVLSKPGNITDHTAWKEGRIIFDSTPISEVIKILERWHGVNFVVKDKVINNYSITAKFNTESIVQIMEMIKYCSLVDYTIDSTTVFLSGRKI